MNALSVHSKDSRAKKPECGAHIRTKPTLRHAELPSLGRMPANSKHLTFLWCWQSSCLRKISRRRARSGREVLTEAFASSVAELRWGDKRGVLQPAGIQVDL